MSGKSIDNRSLIEQYLKIMGIRIMGYNDYGFRCLCPFHNERDPSFSISGRSGWWRCFAYCGSGSFARLLRAFGIDPNWIQMPVWQAQDKNDRAKPRPTEGEILFYGQYLSPHLIQRGFSPEILDRFEIGFNPQKMETIYPIRNTDGKLIAFLRSPKKGKYFHAPKGSPKEEAFFGSQFMSDWDGPTILVEGPVDVLRVWQLGHVPALATMGGSPTHEQITWLKLHASKPIICMLDNDKTGRITSKKLHRQLGSSTRILFVRWNGANIKDPGDLTSTMQLEDLIDSALPFPKI